MAELAAHNRLVGGSSPPGPTTAFLLSSQMLTAARFPVVFFPIENAIEKFRVQAGVSILPQACWLWQLKPGLNQFHP